MTVGEFLRTVIFETNVRIEDGHNTVIYSKVEGIFEKGIFEPLREREIDEVRVKDNLLIIKLVQ